MGQLTMFIYLFKLLNLFFILPQPQIIRYMFMCFETYLKEKKFFLKIFPGLVITFFF